MMNDLHEVRAEVVRLHDFFAGWFQGTIAQGDFEDGIAVRLHPEFENVQPAGHVLTRDALLGPLRRAWGSNPDFRIKIDGVRLLGVWPDCGLTLASYVEAQYGARATTPSDNQRRASVLFQSGRPGLVWRHVHETMIPDNAPRPERISS